MSHFYNTIEAILIVVLVCINIPKVEEPPKPVNTCDVYKCKIENQNKLWDRLCEEFAHLDDDNRKARELFDFIIRLK
jgi:hypothetical protein